MAKRESNTKIKFNSGEKHTRIGNGKRKTSTMNKYARRSYKKYRGQGKI